MRIHLTRFERNSNTTKIETRQTFLCGADCHSSKEILIQQRLKPFYTLCSVRLFFGFERNSNTTKIETHLPACGQALCVRSKEILIQQRLKLTLFPRRMIARNCSKEILIQQRLKHFCLFLFIFVFGSKEILIQQRLKHFEF